METRVDLFQLTITVNYPGLGFLGIWDKDTGGDFDSEETRYRAGAGASQHSLGGAQTVTNIVLTRAYDIDRDHRLVKLLAAARGRATVQITKQPLDIQYSTHGDPITYTGTLKRVKIPESDSEGTAAGLIELEITTDSDIG